MAKTQFLGGKMHIVIQTMVTINTKVDKTGISVIQSSVPESLLHLLLRFLKFA